MVERHRRASRELRAAARELRRRMTPAEEQLWSALRGHGLAGVQFRRQHPVGAFVLDFYCPARRLGIELDGPVHDSREVHDDARTDALAALGIRVVRFRNEEVLTDRAAVLEKIAAEIEEQ